jgi:glycosyltransferase involved in cell wall biosynthesis
LFASSIKERFPQVNGLCIVGKKSRLDLPGRIWCEYARGLKSSNFYIAKLFEYRRLTKLIYWSQYKVVLFEYWHAFATAQKLKQAYPHILTVCDLHNILSYTYPLHISAHPVKRYFAKAYNQKYQRQEFKHALPSFDYLVSINREEDQLLRNEYGSDKTLFCPMGIDLDKFTFVKRDLTVAKFCCLFYGVLSSSNNKRALRQLATVVNGLGATSQTFKLRIAGSGNADFLKPLFNELVTEVMGFVADLGAATTDVQLAVIPWQGKYGFRSRIIELMALGIPVLTTYDAVWGMGLTNGNQLLLINDFEKEALPVLERLLQDRSELQAMALRARRFVEEVYSYEESYGRLGVKLSSLAE